MKQGLTEIILIVDRSGSMQSRRQDATTGINAFIEEQKKLEGAGEANLTLLQFDTYHEYVYENRPIKEVGTYSLEPRGGTALLDAIGTVIDKTGKRFSAMPEDMRPEKVIVCIVTDGEENSSHAYKRDQIKQMIEHQQNVYKWTFIYIGNNVDSFDEAAKLGVYAQNTANFCGGISGYSGISMSVARGRSGLDVSFTAEERVAMMKDVVTHE